MSNLWNAPTHVKIHQKCGGRVRWVEAIDRPGVGWTGECLFCGEENIVAERIIPVEVGRDEDYRDAVLGTTEKERADWDWDDEGDFDENQRRIRRKVITGGEPA